MSIANYLLYLVGIPGVLVVLLALRIWSRKSAHPATYQMSESWAQTHPPILWAAVDEAVGDPHGHHGGKEAEFSVGGGASGKW